MLVSRRPAFSPALVVVALAAVVAACSGAKPAPPVAACRAGTPAASTARPNIVFVLTDDLSDNLVRYMPHVLGLERFIFTPIFALSRMAGWTAHILEQYENNRLMRPESEYVGPANVVYTPLEQRP